jgi:O-antigen/teichoic acid export membrane protein
MSVNTCNRVAAPPVDPTAFALDRDRVERPPQPALWKSTVVVFSGNALARALGFAFPVVLAHLINRDDFAIAYFFINAGFFVAELVTASYATAMIRNIAAERTLARQGTWLVAAMLRGVPLLFLAAIVGETVSAIAGTAPLLMTVMVVGLSIDIYYFGALSGLQKFGTLVGYRIAANATQLILLALLAYLGVKSVSTLVTLYALVYVVPILAIEAVHAPVWSMFKHARWPASSDFTALTRFAMPTLVAGLAYGGVLGFDVVLVRVLAEDELAIYSAARALTLPMTMIPLALGVVLLPRVAATPEAERWRLLIRAVVAACVLSVVVAFAYFVLGGFAIDAMFPAQYHSAISALHALVPALGLLGIYVVLSQWCLGAGFPTLPAWSLSVGALAASGADLILVPIYGAPGAGIGMAIGMLVAIGLIGWLLLRRARQSSSPEPLGGTEAEPELVVRAYASVPR